jgi:zona occludens toxin (predicted ATPase)
MKVIKNEGPVAPSGVTVYKHSRPGYKGEPDGKAYVRSSDGKTLYRVTMRPGRSPSVRVVES